MSTLYVTSFERGAGKTTICAGIGKHLLAAGRKIGYFKPIIADNTESADSDTIFMKNVFTLEESIDLLCPVISNKGNLPDRIKEACAKISPGKDVVIVEGAGEAGIAGALKAKVIIVEGYSEGSPKINISRYKDFGKDLLGVVINKVPRGQAERVFGEISTQLGEAGINVLGVLPEDRALLALTVGELAEKVQGEILNDANKSAELADNLMVGAMTPDSGLDYFGRKANKAAIIRSERPDMQLAALETSTRCLILSGNNAPIPAVLNRAEEKKIPVILAKGNTADIVSQIEDALDKTTLSQERKIPKLTALMEQHFDFQTLDKGLG